MRLKPYPIQLALFAAMVGLPQLAMSADSSTRGSSPAPASSADVRFEEAATFEYFDPTNFSNPTNIDNEWYPMKPGTRLIWEGTSVDDEGVVEPHRVEFVVTDLTKKIGGIDTRVCWDKDMVDGELVETEIVFFAQDDNGAIWSLGEYPEEYEDNVFVDAPCWIHGVKESVAGILVPSDVTNWNRRFSQGWAPSVNFNDYGRIDQLNVETSVPYGTFQNVLVIDEWNLKEPGAHALKYYAPNVGNVRVGTRGSGDQETLELLTVEQLSPEELSLAREAALNLEKRAYEISSDVYAHTEPSMVPDGIRRSEHTFDLPAPKLARASAGERLIDDAQAKAIALAEVPGEVMAIAMETKYGQQTIVVEIIAADGSEIDVILDPRTGLVLATEK